MKDIMVLIVVVLSSYVGISLTQTIKNKLK